MRGVRCRAVSKKVISIVAGGTVLLVWALIQYAESWTLVEHLIEGLRKSGPIGNHFADFVLSPSFPAILGIVVIVIALDLWRKEKERQEQPPIRAVYDPPAQPDTKIEASGNSSATGGSVGPIYIGIPAPPEAHKPVQPTRDSPKWNIAPLPPRTINIMGDEDEVGRLIFREMDHDTGLLGVVVGFRNEPIYGERSYRAENVSAHLIQRDALGQEIGVGISKACWLNNPSDTEDIEITESRCVVLMVTNKSEVVIPCKVRPAIDDGTGVEDKTIPINNRTAVIEARIVNRFGLLLHPLNFAITFEDDRPVAVRRPS
jgi:hypothetical protein